VVEGTEFPEPSPAGTERVREAVKAVPNWNRSTATTAEERDPLFPFR
jgi:hypothetical protein